MIISNGIDSSCGINEMVKSRLMWGEISAKCIKHSGLSLKFPLGDYGGTGFPRDRT